MKMVVQALLLFAPILAQAEWTEANCRQEDGSVLVMRKGPQNTMQVESNYTRYFLAGLQCNIPQPDLPLFSCHQGAGSSLRFQSTIVKESGFPRDAYGEYVEREHLVVYLAYLFENAAGSQEQVEREWRFKISACQWR